MTDQTEPKRDDGLRAAIEAAGGVRPLARKLGISASAFGEWTRVPAYRILQVEAVTGIPRERLCPDLYRLDPDRKPKSFRHE